MLKTLRFKSNILFCLEHTKVVVVAMLAILGNFCLTSFILALRAAVVAKLAILRILSLKSSIFVLTVVLVAKLVKSGIRSSTSFYLS